MPRFRMSLIVSLLSSKAYTKKDDANLKKYAGEAEKIAKQYQSGVIARQKRLPNEVSKELTYLKTMISSLGEVKTKGMGAGDLI
jgi:hypothetical protein